MSGRPDCRRVAVVGGGLTGLTAAYRLAELFQQNGRNLDLTLFEASDSCGGVFGTVQIDGYTVELGADSFITNKPWAVDLCRRLGLEDQLIPTDTRYRRSFVLRKGRPVRIPDGFMLMSPDRLWPIITTPILSLWGKLRLAAEYFIPARRDNPDESLASFVRRRLGQETLDRLVQPLVGGIYTSDPEKLSLRATLPRFLEMEAEHGGLIRATRHTRAAKSRQNKMTASATADQNAGSGARYGLFATLKDGMGTLLQRLESEISKVGQLRCQTSVRSITAEDSNNGRWNITLADGTAETFDAVVVCVPAYVASKLLRPVDGELADRLNSIEYASSAIVVQGYPLSQVRHPLDAFGLVVPAIENRQILAVSFTSRKFPGRAPDGHVELRTFVGGALQPELFQRSDAEIYSIVRRELADMLGVTGEPDFETISRYERKMPQYYVGHCERVSDIFESVAQYPGLALAGNAYHGVGIPDCIHSAEQAAESVFQ